MAGAGHLRQVLAMLACSHVLADSPPRPLPPTVGGVIPVLARCSKTSLRTLLLVCDDGVCTGLPDVGGHERRMLIRASFFARLEASFRRTKTAVLCRRCNVRRFAAAI